ncbi:MAG TPA: hypothetical protein VNS50_08640 [Ginsengibacter sp.]|nr:hypothetical protein [Ginsengibacter sp.]
MITLTKQEEVLLTIKDIRQSLRNTTSLCPDFIWQWLKIFNANTRPSCSSIESGHIA